MYKSAAHYKQVYSINSAYSLGGSPVGVVPSASLNGIVSYATTSTNIIQNNVVTDCNIAFITTQTGTFDIFALNTAYKNNLQYSSNIVGIASLCGCLSLSGENITVVGQSPSITLPGVYALCGNLISVAIK